MGAHGGAVGPRGGDDLRDADVAAVAARLGAELADEVWREAEDGGGGQGAAGLGGEDRLRGERDGGHGVGGGARVSAAARGGRDAWLDRSGRKRSRGLSKCGAAYL